MIEKTGLHCARNAWQQLGNMSAEVAMEQYITLLSERVPGWMQDVHGVSILLLKVLVLHSVVFTDEQCRIIILSCLTGAGFCGCPSV